MKTYLYREKKIKSLFSKKTNTIRSLAGKKKSFDVAKSSARFSKLGKIPRFTGSDVTMARIIWSAEPTSWPLPPPRIPLRHNYCFAFSCERHENLTFWNFFVAAALDFHVFLVQTTPGRLKESNNKEPQGSRVFLLLDQSGVSNFVLGERKN